MAMTKRDFELIAEAVYMARIDDNARLAVVRRLTEALLKTNPRFDDMKFYKACMHGAKRDPSPST